MHCLANCVHAMFNWQSWGLCTKIETISILCPSGIWTFRTNLQKISTLPLNHYRLGVTNINRLQGLNCSRVVDAKAWPQLCVWWSHLLLFQYQLLCQPVAQQWQRTGKDREVYIWQSSSKKWYKNIQQLGTTLKKTAGVILEGILTNSFSQGKTWAEVKV